MGRDAVKLTVRYATLYTRYTIFVRFLTPLAFRLKDEFIFGYKLSGHTLAGTL